MAFETAKSSYYTSIKFGGSEDTLMRTFTRCDVISSEGGTCWTSIARNTIKKPICLALDCFALDCFALEQSHMSADSVSKRHVFRTNEGLKSERDKN